MALDVREGGLLSSNQIKTDWQSNDTGESCVTNRTHLLAC